MPEMRMAIFGAIGFLVLGACAPAYTKFSEDQPKTAEDSATALRAQRIRSAANALGDCYPDRQTVHTFARQWINESPDTAALVACHRIWIGMSAYLLSMSWGRPNDINRTVTATTRHEQWVYRRDSGHDAYVYLENGIVTAIQD